MRKTEWIEEYEREMENYGKSMLSHSDDDYNPMKDYEWSLLHHSDDDYDSMKDYESCISHFQY